MYHPSYQQLSDLIKKYLHDRRLDMIDYGCGNGAIIKVIGKEYIRRYEGYDTNEDGLTVGGEIYPEKKFTFKQLKAGAPPRLGKADSVDLVILVGVLQYLTDSEIEHIIEESARVLKPGGYFMASCVTDHRIYRYTNLYKFFFANRYINRSQILNQFESFNFECQEAYEKGILISPLFSHFFVIFFDALDKLIFRTRGKLGAIGIAARKLAMPLMTLEYALPIDFGFTLFIVEQKKHEV